MQLSLLSDKQIYTDDCNSCNAEHIQSKDRFLTFLHHENMKGGRVGEEKIERKKEKERKGERDRKKGDKEIHPYVISRFK